jgi:hypothetical protein
VVLSPFVELNEEYFENESEGVRNKLLFLLFLIFIKIGRGR